MTGSPFKRQKSAGTAFGSRMSAAEFRIVQLGAIPGKKKKRPAKPRPLPTSIEDIADLPAGSRVVVPFPPVELSPNWRGHWSKKSKAAKNYRNLCWALALEAKLKVPAHAGEDGKIAVRLDFYPPDRSARDDDNVFASFKSGRDGIADAMNCDDARFRTMNFLHDEPRSCVAVTLIQSEGALA